jgi:hypothetical protein
MTNFVILVKGQVEYFDRQIARFGPNHPRYDAHKIQKYQQLKREFEELLAYLVEAARAYENSPLGLWRQRFDDGERAPEPWTEPFPALPAEVAQPPASAPARHAVSDGDDLSDLPPELLEQLSRSVVDGETDPVLKIIKDHGGVATLDEILIDLFRKYKQIGKRPILANKLYRFTKRELVWPVEGKKGTYTTVKQGDRGADSNALYEIGQAIGSGLGKRKG